MFKTNINATMLLTIVFGEGHILAKYIGNLYKCNTQQIWHVHNITIERLNNNYIENHQVLLLANMWMDLRESVFHAYNKNINFSPSHDNCTH